MTDDPSPSAKDLRDRVRGASEDTIGKLAQELLGNPLVTGAVQRAMEVRERATQAQEAAFGALNVPSAADIERLTRRIRNVAQRLESIEDAVDRVDERLASLGGKGEAAVLKEIDGKLDALKAQVAALGAAPASASEPSGAKKDS
jgi:predicted  nucleic acid-binding Zn-ribbon protein